MLPNAWHFFCGGGPCGEVASPFQEVDDDVVSLLLEATPPMQEVSEESRIAVVRRSMAMFGDLSPRSSRCSESHRDVRRQCALVVRHPRLVVSPADGDMVDTTVWHGALTECGICLESLVEGESIQPMAQCRHVLHADCANSWLRSLPSHTLGLARCPMCRGPVTAVRWALPPAEADVAIPVNSVFVRHNDERTF
ncbi:unnamed protein product [Polarella glacialis]|uniref:RING-type domain-containing protein n=1 Tax=Polarella glacialis TaxID=89957 RepID=A0A813KD78_POLGL|nr:unnamed protein product [Polarella glacialis]CAE8704101.1 unnamed protein product [Polarella glacialis]